MFRHLNNEENCTSLRDCLFFLSGNKSKIKSVVMNIWTQKTWQNGCGRQFLCGEGGGQDVRQHQQNAELSCANQGRYLSV